jgi:hypothetical protein
MAEKSSNRENGRFSIQRKSEAVLRLLRGEDLELLSREYGVTAARLSQWRDDFLSAGQQGLKKQTQDLRDEAIDKWVAVVHANWVYLQWRLTRQGTQQLRTPADFMRIHQDEHARLWLIGACQLALQEGSIEPVLQRFLREEA